MHIFEIISKARRENGYYDKDYARYQRHTRNMSRSAKKRDGDASATHCVYLAENSVAKHFLAKRPKVARKHIGKALRLIEKAVGVDQEAKAAFSQYYAGLAHISAQEFRDAGECLAKARGSFENCLAIRGEIDILLDECSQTTDGRSLRPERVKGHWYGVEVGFDSDDELAKFFGGGAQKTRGIDFESTLKNRILRVDSRKKKLVALMAREAVRTRCALAKSTQLLEEVVSFGEFARKNYIESDSVQRFENDVAELNEFLRAIAERRSGSVKNTKAIERFTAPEAFKDLAAAIESCKANKDIDVPRIRRELMGALEKKMVPSDNSLNMPFLPVFYDMASSFITYPNQSEKKGQFSSFISKLSSFSFRK